MSAMLPRAMDAGASAPSGVLGDPLRALVPSLTDAYESQMAWQSTAVTNYC